MGSRRVCLAFAALYALASAAAEGVSAARARSFNYAAHWRSAREDVNPNDPPFVAEAAADGARFAAVESAMRMDPVSGATLGLKLVGMVAKASASLIMAGVTADIEMQSGQLAAIKKDAEGKIAKIQKLLDDATGDAQTRMFDSINSVGRTLIEVAPAERLADLYKLVYPAQEDQTAKTVNGQRVDLLKVLQVGPPLARLRGVLPLLQATPLLPRAVLLMVLMCRPSTMVCWAWRRRAVKKRRTLAIGCWATWRPRSRTFRALWCLTPPRRLRPSLRQPRKRSTWRCLMRSRCPC